MFFTEFFTRGGCPMFLTEWLQVIASCRSPPLRVTLMENMLSLHPIVKTSAFAWKIPLRTTTASVENYLSHSFWWSHIMIRFCLNSDTHLENKQLCFSLNFLFTFPSLENMLSLHPIVKTRAALENTSPNDLLYFSTAFPQHSTLQLYSSLCLPAVFALKVLVGVFSCLSSSITSSLSFISHRFC